MLDGAGALPRGTRVLVVGAHPDDEILGVGGTLARHVEAGHEVQALVVGEGATARDTRKNGGVVSGAAGDRVAVDGASRGQAETGGTRMERADAAGVGAAPPAAVLALKKAACEASRIVGAKPPIFLGLPDERLDTICLLDLVKELEKILAGFVPLVVYTHHGGDLNMDHRLIHQAVMTACRPMPGQPVRFIYTFETLSSTEWTTSAIGECFMPTRFVDITATLERKMEALEAYGSEMRPFPHSRSFEGIRALARLRGVTVGFEAAEAFMVIREIVG